jgi:hypothetical protein
MENAQELVLEEIRDFLVMVAHKAGDMILAARPSTGKMDLKKNCEFLSVSFYARES